MQKTETNVTQVAKTDDWPERLRESAPDRDAAIEELRIILMKGLAHMLRGRNSSIQPDDIVQDAMLKILNKLDTFEGRSKFTTWAMTIATRTAISEMRRKHCQNISLDSMMGDELKFEIVDTDLSASGQEADKNTILIKLKELINTRLTDKQRLAVNALLNGMPVEEIASRTDSNRNAVYKLFHDARSNLREGFEKAGISADDINAIFA